MPEETVLENMKSCNNYCRIVGQRPIVTITTTVAKSQFSIAFLMHSALVLIVDLPQGAKVKGLAVMPLEVFTGDPILLACDYMW